MKLIIVTKTYEQMNENELAWLSLDWKHRPVIRIQCVIKHQLCSKNVALHCWNGQAGAQESISLCVNGLLLLHTLALECCHSLCN